MNDSSVYLDTYVLQQDMRIRMPKAILTNIGAQRGETKFDIYLDPDEKSIILKAHVEIDEVNGKGSEREEEPC